MITSIPTRDIENVQDVYNLKISYGWQLQDGIERKIKLELRLE